jgi:hypothetical protein
MHSSLSCEKLLIDCTLEKNYINKENKENKKKRYIGLK